MIDKPAFDEGAPGFAAFGLVVVGLGRQLFAGSVQRHNNEAH